jgi:NADH-quinone oxidoreductase subunit K
MIVPYEHVLMLAGILLLIGAVCVAARRNLIMMLIGVEVMLNAAGLAFVGASLHWREIDGQVFVIFIMAIAAAEIAVGLALVVYAQRRSGSVHADFYGRMKG